jgi:hypothetical protein
MKVDDCEFFVIGFLNKNILNVFGKRKQIVPFDLG